MADGLLSPDDMMMGDEGLLFRPEDIEAAGNREAAADFVRGVSYAPFDLLGAPVDITNMALQPLGLGSDKPFMGSNFLIDAYASVFPEMARKDNADEMMGRVIGGVTLDPFLVGKGAIFIGDEINSARQAKKLRDERQGFLEAGDQASADQAGSLANVLETDAAPLTGILQRIEANGQRPQFEVRDDGVYLTVRPSGVSDEAPSVVERVRAEGEGTPSTVGKDAPLTKAEIDYIVNDPNLNSALVTANRISMEANGVPYDINVLSAGKDGRSSSIAKQA